MTDLDWLSGLVEFGNGSADWDAAAGEALFKASIALEGEDALVYSSLFCFALDAWVDCVFDFGPEEGSAGCFEPFVAETVIL